MVNGVLPDVLRSPHERSDMRDTGAMRIVGPAYRCAHAGYDFVYEENRSNFRKIWREFESNMDKIAMMRRTSPSTASASVASTAVKTPRGTKGRVMMFLIRTAFWLSVAIVLLPTPDSVKTPESKVGATQAMSAASAAVSDMRSFCTRQPDACEVGSHALTAFGYKAQASAKWVYEFLSAKLGSEHAATAAAPGKAAPAVETAPSQHTLTPTDVTPAWRGPRQQADARRPG
jgi:hypothetical protein